MRLCSILPVVTLSLASCAVPVEPLLGPERIIEVSRTSMESSLLGEPLDQTRWMAVDQVDLYDAHARRPSGMGSRLWLLDAVTWQDRDDWLDRMARVDERSSDSLLDKTVNHLLEQDDAYLAAELEGDRAYSWFAGFFNGVMKMGMSLLTANPVGLIRPVLRGGDALLGLGDLEPRDRKLAELYRRWLDRHPDGAGLSCDVADAKQRIEAVETEIFEEELILTRRLIEQRNLGAAAAHLHVAQIRRPSAKEVVELQAVMEERLESRAERRRRGVAVDPLEMELVRGTPELNQECVTLVEEILLGYGHLRFAELAARAADAGREDVAQSLLHAAELLVRTRDLEAEVTRVKRDHSARQRHYVLTGTKPNDDPLDRYLVAQRDARRTLGDVLEPILWIPATLARLIYTTFADPIDDQPVIDALAIMAWNTPPGAQRDSAIEELSDRYEDRGATAKALAAAELLPDAGERVARLEEDLATSILDDTSGWDVTARGEALTAIIEHYPGTAAAEQARVELNDLASDLFAGAIVIPAVALVPLAEELGIDPRLLDGQEENGEIARPGIRYLGDVIHFEVESGDERERFSMTVEGDVKRRLEALVAEWHWRRRAADTATYRDLHEGVPVELRAGIGAQGVGIYPRLLPERYKGRDRALFE